MKKPVIGIVGAVGSGKSTVAAEFARQGCVVIAADEINRKILARPEMVEKLCGWWSDKVLEPRGSGRSRKLNHRAVGEIVFNNAAELKRLTDLTHPLIRKEVELQLDYYQGQASGGSVVRPDEESGDRQRAEAAGFVDKDGRKGPNIASLPGAGEIRAIILDVPLLIELEWQDLCDSLIFVQVEREIRWRRLRENRGWDEKIIKNVENLQIMLDKKAEISEYMVENNSDIPDLADQIAGILSHLAS